MQKVIKYIKDEFEVADRVTKEGLMDKFIIFNIGILIGFIVVFLSIGIFLYIIIFIILSIKPIKYTFLYHNELKNERKNRK